MNLGRFILLYHIRGFLLEWSCRVQFCI